MSEKHEGFEIGQGRQTAVLPLFPLRLVLFPGQILPLHIFEPRYKLMVDRCIDEREPFGVVLMREDTPDWRTYDGHVALPHPVGTTAHIHRVERLRDGRLNIVVVGLRRFRVRQHRFDMPFLQGEVIGYPLTGDRDAPSPHVEAVRRLLRDYADILAQLTDSHIDLEEIPEDPQTLAFLAAGILQISWDEKQALLDVADVSELLARERTLLGMEKMLLSYMVGTQAQVDERAFGPSGYLFPN